ncbi:alpha/beta hydrolase [Gandjariella thermophila]|uniref:alpha/beta hydrolase n=1 Tax=Gandjariella thermophila TaxID=1931992 RepID=UPI001865620C|nr:alpha/beta hydrolase [Gandjariella thermophila]
MHGAWHGAWVWSEFAKVLARRGIDTEAVNLTSQGHDPATIGDLRSDVDLLRDTIAKVPGPVVVLSHSAYGGMVTSEAADGPGNVARLIFLTSFAPEVGESLSGLFGGDGQPPFIDPSNGLLTVKQGWGSKLFFSDCPPPVAAEAEARLLPQNAVSFGQEVRAAAWRRIPSSYIICTEDQAMPAPGQRRMADRVGDAVELRSGHSPFLSQPDRLADLVVERL